MGQSRPLFVLFSFFSHYNFNTNWKKHRWCAWDSNPGPQDGRCRRNHRAMAATPLYFKICLCPPMETFVKKWKRLIEKRKSSNLEGKEDQKGIIIRLKDSGIDQSPGKKEIKNRTGAGLVVMVGDSCSKGCEFESRHRILDGHFSHLFVVKIVMCVWRDENKLKRGWGWPIFKKN